MRVHLTAARSIPCSDLAAASRLVQQYRDAKRIGASRFSGGRVVNDQGATIAHVSYNGRVWASQPTPGAMPSLLLEAAR